MHDSLLASTRVYWRTRAGATPEQANDPRPFLVVMGALTEAEYAVVRFRRSKADASRNMKLWAGLCGRYPANYGTRMPDNMTEHALAVGVLAS